MITQIKELWLTINPTYGDSNIKVRHANLLVLIFK